MIADSMVRYFRVDRRDLVYLKFILEAYEGLSTLSTVDNQGGIVKLSFMEWGAEDVSALLRELRLYISIDEVNFLQENKSA